MTAERTTDANRTFAVRDDDGELVGLFSFRAICALAAVADGRATTVLCKRSWYGMYDEWFEPHTELFGVGTFTLQELQRHKLVAPCSKAGAALELTERGRATLDALAAAGVQPLLTMPLEQVA